MDVCRGNWCVGLYIYGSILSKMIKKIIFLILLTNHLWLKGQCAMCKATVESNAEAGGALADGLNEGILYLMAFPYLILGAICIQYF